MSRPARTRQSKADDDLAVPSGSDDPAERKRILNVLAQRRYRKKKKEHVKALESQVNGKTTVQAEAESEPPVQTSRTGSVQDRSVHSIDLPRQLPNVQSSEEGSSSAEWLAIYGTLDKPQVCTTAPMPQSHEDLYPNLGPMSHSSQAPEQTSIDLLEDPIAADIFAQQQEAFQEPTIPEWVSTSITDNCQTYFSSGEPQSSTWNWDPLAFTPSASLPSTPGPDSTSPENNSSSPDDPRCCLSSSSSSSSSSRPSSLNSPPASHLSTSTTALQAYQTTSPSLSSAQFHIPALNLLRGFLSIASFFNVTSQIFLLDSVSPFTSPNPPPLPPHLPANLHPTLVQLTTPHHPILDLLPWPVTRDKLILTFSSPPHLRPLQAQSETALLELVYDIEDGSEGVRIWGENPTEERNWEVGSKVFERWWWAFDGEILRRSNEWRVGRGARRLRGMGMGTGKGGEGGRGNVLGEVG